MTSAFTLAIAQLDPMPRPDQPATPSAFAEACSRGKWHRAPHLDVIEAVVLDAIREAHGVMLSVAVRHGKSEYASLWLIA